MRDRFYTVQEEGDGNNGNNSGSDTNVGSGEERRGRNCRDVGAPRAGSSDDEVDHPVHAADRGTRPSRESFIPNDGIDGVTEETSVRQALERLAAGRGGGSDDEAHPPRVDYPRQLNPLPEQRTPYLASTRFPWVFPGGRTYPVFGARPRGVSFAEKT